MSETFEIPVHEAGITNTEIVKAIHRSQHCQRNWDLSAEIPEDDIQTMITAITQCPSKQNIAFYRVHIVTNRDLIERIHALTDGFHISLRTRETTTNTQTLANLLFVFERYDGPVDKSRNMQVRKLDTTRDGEARDILETDRKIAVGIAAGYLNLTASLLGYATGCCSCFSQPGVREVLGLERNPLLLMGVGVKDPNRNRRVHHLNPDFIFPTKTKQEIPVQIVS